MDNRWIAAMILASGVAAESASDEDAVYPQQNTPDSQALTDPYRNVYSPIKGTRSVQASSAT